MIDSNCFDQKRWKGLEMAVILSLFILYLIDGENGFHVMSVISRITVLG